MKALIAAIQAETLKLRRSKLLWVTILLFSILPLMIGFIASGTLTPTAQAGETDKSWTAYLSFIIQAFSGIGVLGLGFVASWLFGREYSDRTLKDLLALPVPRQAIVWAKFMVMAVWGCVLTAINITLALGLGFVFGLEGDAKSAILSQLQIFGVTAAFVILLSAPVTTLASIGKGYLAPIGFVVIAMVAAQFSGGLGIGHYFPWQIPGEYIAAAGKGATLGLVSYGIIGVTALGGVLGTLLWWRYTDQT